MSLDDRSKEIIRELGDAINFALGESQLVSDAIKRLRESGLEIALPFHIEISLQNIFESSQEFSENINSEDDNQEDIQLDLTDEDLKTLRRMKIRLE